MSRLSRRFGGLRWRLMLAFFVTAWIGMIALEGLFVVIPDIASLAAPQRPIALAQDLSKLAPRLAPALAQTPPDRARLVATLGSFKQPMLISEALTDNIRGSVTIIAGDNASLFVVTPDGSVVAALPASARSASDLAGIQNDPAARAVISAARHGGRPTADWSQSTASGLTVAAAPITDASGAVRGVLLLGVDLAALARPILLKNLLALIPSTIVFALIASAFGALFGSLTANRLTRRLSRLTTSADAWSQGDFSVVAHDPSPDELGQLARDLNRMAEQLQSLLQDQQRLAVAEERNRLARDLHDSVKQQMFALTMLLGSAQMEVADGSEARRTLQEAERIAGGAQQELTSLIHALRPVAMANQSLSVALRELCESWAKRTGATFDVRIPDGLTLTPSAEQEVFRTAQEALANVARHSGATRVEVRAERDSERLTLRIRDNGHGFDVARADRQGVGLRSMRERIEGLGGTLQISSVPGGTRIELSVPVAQDASAGRVASAIADPQAAPTAER